MSAARTRESHACGAETVSLLAPRRRFAVGATREEARLFCEDLVANDTLPTPALLPDADPRLVA